MVRWSWPGAEHWVTDILTIALCGVISGADGWEDVAEYGRSKRDFFKRFLALPNGIPSHDTFYRVFARLDPAAFAQRVGRWMAAACEATGLVPIAIDGKSAPRAKAATATGCLHAVSAWATASGLTLGQVTVPDGSNEIAVVPDLLRVLGLAGAIVTVDAAGCQTENARLIREGEGRYLLAVKGNQPNLHAAVRAVFERADAAGWAGVRFDTHASAEDGHGRHEERMTTVIYDPVGLSPDWPDVAAVVLIGRERTVGAASTSAGQYSTTSPVMPARPKSWATWPARTGRSRTVSTGYSTWRFGRTRVGPATPRRGPTWPCSGGSRCRS